MLNVLRFFLSTLWDGLRLKNISRYCPIKRYALFFLTCLHVRTKVVRDLERGVSILDTAHEFKPKKIYLKIANEFYFNKKLQKKEPLERQFFGVNRMELENKLMCNGHSWYCSTCSQYCKLTNERFKTHF